MFPHLSPPFAGHGSLDALVRAASGTPVPDAAEERRLVDRAHAGDEAARDRLLEAHLRVVVDEIIRYRDTDRDAGELAPIGIQALRSAVARFDPARHGRLVSYARQWVRMEFRRDDARA